jgi:hypothetical protein
MARHGKFSFPIPGRRQKKTDQQADHNNSPLPPAHEWPSRLDEPSSKAHRVLGTSEPMFRTTSKQTVPPSPGFMSISVSEASYGSHRDDRADPNGSQGRLGVSRRPSSNLMGHAYSGEGRRGSDFSTASHRLHPQTSSSTLRSHYDAKSSPLSISQQTSDSAVRDMALRRGQPPIVTEYNSNGDIASPMSPAIRDETRRKEQRKSKPARLDLSKLFPKPRTGESHSFSNALLSPSKMVNSPAALSINSDYQFPRPMTREPTPNPRGQVKLKKAPPPQPVSVPPTPTSPARRFRRDEYDNAKVHVRRPPKGVQHWFDALDEDSDEARENRAMPVYAPTAVRPTETARAPARKTSNSRLGSDAGSYQGARSHHLSPAVRCDTFTHEDLVDVARLTSPSQISLQSTRTKESALSKTNLQDSSVLSFSSSEEESDEVQSKPHKVAVRKSLDTNEDSGEIIIGRAEAFEMRHHRNPSAAQMSMRSTSTSAATIEVMYTPEPPFSPFHYPRNSSYSGSRRSSHMRQPSVIHEDDNYRPQTAVNRASSPPAQSIRSVRTSTSEPKSRSDGSHKLMEVTEEEEALLELMRKKRAAMAKALIPQVIPPVGEQDKQRQTPPQAARGPYRTSGFLAEASPVRAVERKASKRNSTLSPSPLQLPPRGRPLKAHYDATMGLSHLRDDSTSDAWSDRQSSPASHVTMPPHLPAPSAFSPLDPFPPPSPMLTASMTSPTTTEHASPLPSPVTPGLRAYEEELNVKVANSDTSNDLDELTVLDTGVIDISQSRGKSPSDVSSHRRRRTASSGADVTFPVPPTHGIRDLTPVSEASSRPPSIIEPPISRKATKRVSGLTLLTNGTSRSRQSSVASQTSQQSHASSYINGTDKKSSRYAPSSTGSSKGKRSSVSDDVLAAWGSLGGTY